MPVILTEDERRELSPNRADVAIQQMIRQQGETIRRQSAVIAVLGVACVIGWGLVVAGWIG